MLCLGLAVTCAGTVAGCEDDLAPVVARDGSPVQTDSLAYTFKRELVELHPDEWRGAWRAYVLATYRNSGAATAYFRRCTWQDSTPVFYFRRTGADSLRELFSDHGWLCTGGVPTGSIPRGEAVSVQVVLGSVDQLQMQPPYQLGWLVGVLRVEFELCRSYASRSEDCELLPQAERQSNAFEVHF